MTKIIRTLGSPVTIFGIIPALIAWVVTVTSVAHYYA